MNLKKSIYILLFVIGFQSGSSQILSGTEHFRIPRNLPFRDIGISKKIYVSDYVKNNMSDTEAIRSAIDALSKMSGNIELIFDKKKYEVNFIGSSNFFFEISDLSDKIINGNNAEIILKNPTKGFLQLKNAKHCIVKNFKIDYNPLPFVQARIIDVDQIGNTADCMIDSGFPDFDDEHIINAPQKWAMLKDSLRPGCQKENVKSGFSASSFEKKGDRLYRLSFKGDNIQSFSKGDVYVQVGRYNGSTIINMKNCEKISVINVTAFSSPAGGFNARQSSEINILECNILIAPGRFISSNADCLHHIGERIGTWVEGCIFEGHSDDTFNFKWGKANITAQISNNTILSTTALQENESLWIYNPREGILIDTVYVTNCTKTENRKFEITLNKNIPTLMICSENQRGDQFYLDSERNESFVIRNNVIRNHRRYGMLLQSGYGLVENNHFENSSNSAITIENGVDWGEGLVVQHLLIRNNRFVNSGSDYSFLNENKAVIFIQTSKLKNVASETKWYGVIPSLWRGMSDIQVENNQFDLVKGSAVSVNSAENIVISNNNFNISKDFTLPFIFKQNALVEEQNNKIINSTN